MPQTMIEHVTYINMIPGVTPPPVINVGQGDDGFSIALFPVCVSRGIIPKYPAPVTSDAELDYVFPRTGSSATVKVRGIRSDGTTYTANASLGSGVECFVVTGDKQMTSVAGDMICEIVLIGSDNLTVLTSENFTLRIEKAAK